MEEMINAMITIIESHNGECALGQMLKELQLYDEYINQSEIDRIIWDYPQIFKRTPEIKTKDGRTISEEGLTFADGITM